MRGVALDTFGGPEVLRLRDDLPEPVYGQDTVLVRVHAAGVNPVDWKIREGYLAGRFPHHFPVVPGWDLAGVVEHVGDAVTEFSPGEEVLGYVRRDEVQHGTYAELVPAPVRTLAPKPAEVSMTAGAALPLAGLTAFQALTGALGVREGDRVLIHAASGGVGSFAVQLAVDLGAQVIGTASAANHDHVRALGAAEVLDYSAGPISEQLSEPVDAVLDLVGGAALADAPNQVREGDTSRVASIVDAATVKGMGGRYVFVRPDQTQLAGLVSRVLSGKLRITVAATYPLEEAAEAQVASQSGHTRGKIVLTVG